MEVTTSPRVIREVEQESERNESGITSMEKFFLQMVEQNKINLQILEMKKEKLQKSGNPKQEMTLKEYREYFSSILSENYPGSSWHKIRFDKDVSQDNANFLVELGRMQEFCKNPPRNATEKDVALAWKFVETLMKDKMGFIYALDKHGLEAAKHVRESNETPSMLSKIQEEVDNKVKKFRKKKTAELVVSKLTEKVNSSKYNGSTTPKRGFKKMDENGYQDQTGSKKQKGSFWCGICHTNTHSTFKCRYADRNKRAPDGAKSPSDYERKK